MKITLKRNLCFVKIVLWPQITNKLLLYFTKSNLGHLLFCKQEISGNNLCREKILTLWIINSVEVWKCSTFYICAQIVNEGDSIHELKVTSHVSISNYKVTEYAELEGSHMMPYTCIYTHKYMWASILT